MKQGISNPKNQERHWEKYLLLLGLMMLLPLCTAASAQAKGFCSATTDAAAKSCNDELQADYWLAVGKCNNIADADAREECLLDAMEERKEASDECKEQTLARQEICTELGEEAYDPMINPADFSTVIDNPYLPMTPGTTMVYENEIGDELITVTVTDQTVEILGVECVVVRDTVYEGATYLGNGQVDGGALVEDTWDWFAQDNAGNVWYFGEHSREYEEGQLVSLEGSWTAGVDGAKPGIVMLADPMEFDMYRQEFLLGEAEDMALVTDTEAEEVVLGYAGELETDEWTPIEPDVHENKYYAEDIGLILETNPETGERVELIDIVK